MAGPPPPQRKLDPDAVPSPVSALSLLSLPHEGPLCAHRSRPSPVCGHLPSLQGMGGERDHAGKAPFLCGGQRGHAH